MYKFITVVLILVSTQMTWADSIVEDTAEASYQRAQASATNFAGAPLTEPHQAP